MHESGVALSLTLWGKELLSCCEQTIREPGNKIVVVASARATAAMELDALDAYMEQVASHTQSIPEDAAPTNSRCVLLVHVLTPEAALMSMPAHCSRAGRECER